MAAVRDDTPQTTARHGVPSVINGAPCRPPPLVLIHHGKVYVDGVRVYGAIARLHKRLARA